MRTPAIVKIRPSRSALRAGASDIPGAAEAPRR